MSLILFFYYFDKRKFISEKKGINKKLHALFAYKTNKQWNLFYTNSENYLNFLFYKFSLQ